MTSTTKPRVLWLINHMIRFVGGTRYVFEVTRRLRQHYDLILGFQRATVEWRNLFRAHEINAVEFGGPTSQQLPFWLLSPIYIRRYKRQLEAIGPFDLIVSNMFPMNLVAAKFERVPLVQLIYEPFAQFHDPIWLRGWPRSKQLLYRIQRLLYQQADIRTTRRADRVLTLSKHNADWIRRVYGVDSTPVYEGVDIDMFRPTVNEQIQDRYKSRLLLLHFSRFETIKGVTQLIKALPDILQSFPETLLCIPGSPTRTKVESDALKLASSLGVTHAIERPGFLPDTELPAYYTAAKIVVQPSLNQSMSLPAKEAMSCGTPVIRGLEAYEEVVDGETGFLVDSEQPSQVADAVKILLGDKALRRKMGVAGRQHVMKYFTWDKVSKRISNVLNEFL